jgi:hypothetical protein
MSQISNLNVSRIQLNTQTQSTTIDIKSLQNRLLRVCNVPATSASLPRISFFFSFLFLLLRPLTVLMKQTRQTVRAVKQSIFLDVYGTNLIVDWHSCLNSWQLNLNLCSKQLWTNYKVPAKKLNYMTKNQILHSFPTKFKFKMIDHVLLSAFPLLSACKGLLTLRNSYIYFSFLLHLNFDRHSTYTC